MKKMKSKLGGRSKPKFIVEALKKHKEKLKKKAKTKPAKKKYTHHPDHYNKSESFLIDNKKEDLQEAWFKLREFAASLGPQKIYASGKAIMFSKKVCYCFVRPKKSHLEVVIFLKTKKSQLDFKSIRPVSKTKLSHTFQLIHSDQVEGPLTTAIAEAYTETPPQEESI